MLDIILLQDGNYFIDKNNKESNVLLPNYSEKLVSIAAQMHHQHDSNNKINISIMPSYVNTLRYLKPIIINNKKKSLQKIDDIKDNKNKFETSSLNFKKYIPKKIKRNFSLNDNLLINYKNFYLTKHLNKNCKNLTQNNLLKNQLNSKINLLNNFDNLKNCFNSLQNFNCNSTKNLLAQKLINLTTTTITTTTDNNLQLFCNESNISVKKSIDNLPLFDDNFNSIYDAQIKSLKIFLFQSNNKETLL